MIDFKAGLQKYIEAEVERRVEDRLAKVLEELGIAESRRLRRPPSAGTTAASKSRGAKPGRIVSAETRAKMKAAWALRKKGQEHAREGDGSQPQRQPE
jgi:hypothetical protein